MTQKFNQNILTELQQFIELVTVYRNHRKLTANPSIRTSLLLLDNLPAAREAIFDYFAIVAEVCVKYYIKNAKIDLTTGLPISQSKPGNGSNGTPQNPTAMMEDETFSAIQDVLEDLINKGPPAWSPLIASWSLDLVGSLSDKFTTRKMTIIIACNYWLSCSCMRGLLRLISICFRKLNNSEAEACVETLLTTYQRYPQTFDWVVARLGGCFPLKIISQTMQYSLKRFMEDTRGRFDTEIGILDYLSTAHEGELKNCLRDLLQEGFQPKKNLDVTIIPFLLVIANCSDSILQTLVKVFLSMYNDDLRNNIIQKAPLWMSNKYFADIQPSLNNIALRLRVHGASLLILVAKMADQYSWCQDFLELSLQELEQVILNAQTCPLMDDLATEDSKYLLWKSCLSKNFFEQQTAIRLLLIICTQHSNIYYQTLSELLRKNFDEHEQILGAVIRLLSGQYGVVEFPDVRPALLMVFEDVLLQEQFSNLRLRLSNEKWEALNTFKNLLNLTKLQKKEMISYMLSNMLVNALNDCLHKILSIVDVTLNKITLYLDEKNGKRNLDESIDEETAQRLKLAHIIFDLLNTIEAGSKIYVLRTSEVLKLSVLSVNYFYISLAQSNLIARSAAVNRVCQLFTRQCSVRKMSRATCLRELIEGALFVYGYLFGQIEEPYIDELEIPRNERVLHQNQRQTLGPNVNRTVLHAGVIGRGLRGDNPNLTSKMNHITEALLIKALNSCCIEPDKANPIEGYSMISLLLVELVSSDVMYNGLPFPDEEFTKVTMERDLLIRRAFLNSPILWSLLGFIANHRPALCFSSVLLRAICATCLHQWKSKNVNKYEALDKKDELVQCTIKLLEVLSLGQILPPPLSTLHMIIEYFDSAEIALVLRECIWSYLKDHVPSPALFQIDNNGLHWRNTNIAKAPAQYVDTLRNLMQKKLPKLGEHYHQMFIMTELHEFNSPIENVIKAEKMEVDT